MPLVDYGRNYKFMKIENIQIISLGGDEDEDEERGSGRLQAELNSGFTEFFNLQQKYNQLLTQLKSQEFMINTLLGQQREVIEPTENW